MLPTTPTRSTEAFRAALRVDAATWARGRDWALRKALITLRGALDDGDASDPLAGRQAPRALRRQAVEAGS